MAKKIAPGNGFTIIEISMVLVIIGLVMGSILVGRDLTPAAQVRAQVSQIENYNTAVRTFQTKYNCLPGDCANAAQFGFPSRGQYRGEGDGNGVIEGVYDDSGPGYYYGIAESAGETAMFWIDLSQAGLIGNSFNTASSHVIPGANITDVGSYLPPTKIGGNNYIFVWSGGYRLRYGHDAGDGNNYFGLAGITAIQGAGSLGFLSNTGLFVQDAYNIDTKMDDGLPQSGRIIAFYIYAGVPVWVAHTDVSGGYNSGAWDGATGGPTTAATPGDATTCYHNNSVNGAA